MTKLQNVGTPVVAHAFKMMLIKMYESKKGVFQLSYK